MTSVINEGIINLHNDNKSLSSNNGLLFKLSGKGLLDTSNINNIYDKNGLGLQLFSNNNNYREISIIDTSNIYNSNFSTLRIGLNSNSTTIKSITSNSIYKPLIINNNITITSNTLDIKGNTTLNGTLIINNSEITSCNSSLPITTTTSNIITNSSYIYYQFNSNNTVSFINPIFADLLLVGAGGNGGIGYYSGGGGAGEVIYYPNFPFLSGLYTFSVGISTNNPNNRISKISFNNNDIIKANGGGDGGYISSQPTITNATISSIPSTTYNYIAFTINDTITFPINMNCDIFMIGGGGGGGYNHGGGGGAGAYFSSNYIFQGGISYSIIIGNGGTGGTGSAIPTNGTNTIIRKTSDNSIIFQVNGGGAGGHYDKTPANNGGCGGGGLGWDNNRGDVSFSGSNSINIGTNGIGFNGGDGNKVSSSSFLMGGGGGGCGSTGTKGTDLISGSGGNAIKTNIKGFDSYYGGGGSGFYFNGGFNNLKNAKGGGLDGFIVGGYFNISGDYINAVSNTGSGGFGGSPNFGNGGNGANGIVIIRYNTANLSISPLSGGSGGGGAQNQLGAIAATPNSIYSYINSGNTGTSNQGGNGGNALSNSGYITTITGINTTVGIGGSGVGILSTPINGSNYGDGGSGNGGLGNQGIIIIKINNTSTNSLSLKSDNININNLNITSNITIGGTIYKTDGSIFATSGTNNIVNNQWSYVLNTSNIYYDKGFIGIGTNNPQSLLHLSTSNSNNDIIIKFTDYTTGYTSNDGLIVKKDGITQSGFLWNYENADLIFGTSNKERLRITSNGLIGIGITNPNYNLDIISNINTIEYYIKGYNISNIFLTSNDYSNINLQSSNNNILYTNTTSNITYSNLSNINLQSSNNNISYTNTTSNITYSNLSNLDFKSSNNNILYTNTTSNITYSNLSNLDFKSSNNNILYTNTTSNITYSNLSNINLLSSNNNILYTSNTSNLLNTKINLSSSLWNLNQNYIYNTNISNVGIGTTNPQFTLDIWGGSNINDGITNLRLMNNALTNGRTQLELIGRVEGNDDWDMIGGRNIIKFGYKTSQSTNIINYTNSIQSVDSNLGFFSVGFSKTNPSFIIRKDGNITITSNLQINNSIIGKNNSTGSITFNTNYIDRIIINDDGTNRLRLTSNVNFSMYPGSEFQIDKPGIVGGTFLINSIGYVGLSNINPYIHLSVGGTANNHKLGRCINSTTAYTSDKIDTFQIGRWDGFYTNNQFSGINLVVCKGSDVGEQYDNQNYISFNTWGNNIEVSREVMRINQKGRVGIGTTNPQFTLDINGNLGSSEIFIKNNNISNIIDSYLLNINKSTGTIITGKITANTSTQGSINITGSGDVRYRCYNGAGITEWIWGQKSNTNNNWILSKINSGNETDIITVNVNGNIGFGTTNPQYILDIWGGSGFSDPDIKLRLMNNGLTNGRTQLELIGRYESPVFDQWDMSNGRNIIKFGYKTSQSTDIINYGNSIQSFDSNLGFFSAGFSKINPVLFLGKNGTTTINSTLRMNIGAYISMYPGNELQIDIDGVIGGAFIVKSNGNVGINNNNPQYKLSVNGNVNTGALVINDTNTIGPNDVKAYYIYGYDYVETNQIWYGAYNSLINNGKSWFKDRIAISSDIRIKKNIQDINDDSALQKILQIQPKTYEYIDKIKRGNSNVYGFISQQIKEIIPEAVSLTEEYIPNIYNICDIINTSNILITSNLINELNINDEIETYNNLGEKNYYKIKNINSNIIEIDKEISNSNIFIYGKKVTDFHTLDKTYIYTLNVCATQEIYRIIQRQQEQINEMQIQINNQSNIINQMQLSIQELLNNK